MPCANGATSNCSHRGNTMWIAQRSGCWPAPAGTRPTRPTIRRGPNCLSTTSRPLARHPAIAPHIHTSRRVTDISRVGFDKLKSKDARRRRSKSAIKTIRTGKAIGMRVSRPKSIRADAVIDTSGTWHSPNPAGASRPARHRRRRRAKIVLCDAGHPGRDRARYAGKVTAVLGAGHSAIGTLDGPRTAQGQMPGTEAIWLLRSNNPAKAFGGGANDKHGSARANSGPRSPQLVAAGEIKVEMEFRVSAPQHQG